MADYLPIIYDKKIKDRFLEMTTETAYNREVIFAKQAFDGSDLLQKCAPESIRNSIVNIALTGASLNPVLQQSYLIPRKGKCCLDFSYRGLCKIAIDSGSVYDIDAVPVFEGDEFYYEMGLNPALIHKPKMHTDAKDKKLIAVYAIAVLHHGIKKFVVLDKEKIERARKSSQADLVWKAHYDEMAKKTAVKLLYKLLPQSEKMSLAISSLNEHEGIDVNSQDKAQEVMNRFKLKQPPSSDDVVDIQEIKERKADPSPGHFECPNDNTFVTKEYCNAECNKREGCPAF